ncbi:FERM domain-containing protein [Meloidogyne graminicola]|uniref:Moesin/ezrin/radixin homolog 1 n=1 Tax=Meloidogyne graminicola TaxID=189291 RepID=A0A8S9ZVC0_9BILA|nr:FERM domain-containing protein [Meloidogyne graminicola]
MASNFLRTLSQRFTTKSKNCSQQQQQPRSSSVPRSKETINRHCQCRVQLLDNSDLNILIRKTAMGQELYQRVYAHLGLIERDYFGLQFIDHFQVRQWLDPAKRIRKQLPFGPPYNFRLRVKFFSNDPANLRDELTRYLFFTQLRQDIQTGLLDCPPEGVIDLAALGLQSEFGDFNPQTYSSTFASEFRFHPLQNEQMELAILCRWADKQFSGMTPSRAESAFLERAKRLPLYGVDLHNVQGKDGCDYRLGLSPQGMLVLDGRQKIGLFLWEKVQRLDFRGRRLTLVVEEELTLEQQKNKGTFVFQLNSSRAAKHLWKCAIEFHTFFRLKYIGNSGQNNKRLFPPFFRLGSTFRYRFL